MKTSRMLPLGMRCLRSWLVPAAMTAGLLAGGTQTGAELRIVDESAPPGGMALFIVELTEPKPITKGEICFTYSGSSAFAGSSVIANGVPLAPVSEARVALLSSTNDVSGSANVVGSNIEVLFDSPNATFGNEGDIPVMLVAVPVPADASPGAQMSVTINPVESFLLDPLGQPYAVGVKQGTFRVGGVSINEMTPASGTVQAGDFITFRGAGFEPGVEIDIQEASHQNAEFISPTELRVQLDASFTIRPYTRIRLRNPDPDRAEDLLYPAALQPGLQGNATPIARDDFSETLLDTPIEIAVLGNDDDPDGDPLTVESLTQPSHGTASLLGSQSVLYTPAAGFTGEDQFSYTAGDGKGATSSALVRVQVEGPALIITPSSLTLPLGASAEVTVEIAAGLNGNLQLSADPALLGIGRRQTSPLGSNFFTFRIVADQVGSGLLTAQLGIESASIPFEVVAGSLLRIPVVRNDSKSRLGLGLTNQSAQTVQYHLRAFRSGTPDEIAPLAWEADGELGPFQQTASFLSELDDALDGFGGWIEIQSLQPCVHANFLNLPAESVDYAGDSGSIAPVMETIILGSSDLQSPPEFEVVNPGVEPNLLTIDWISPQGELRETLEETTLAGQGSLLASLPQYFALPEGAEIDGYLHLRSQRPVLAYQQSIGDDYIFGQAAPSPEANSQGQLLVPHFLSGGGFFTEITLANLSGTAGTVEALWIGEQGDPVAEAENNPAQLPIGAGEQLILRGADLFGSLPELVSGSLILKTPPRTVAVAWIGKESDSSYRAAVPAGASGLTEAVFSQAAVGPFDGFDLFTGLAFQNIGQAPTLVRIKVYNAAGDLTGQAEQMLDGGGRLARLLTELIPGLPPQIGGHVRVASDSPIQLLELFGDSEGSFLSTVSASPTMGPPW